MTRKELHNWLRTTDPQALEGLWRAADDARSRHVGDAVHLRGLIEISNHCVRACTYCGLRAPNRDVPRYRMTADEILACARQAVAFEYGTVVLQAGQDPGITVEWMAEVVRRIKAETDLAVTLSLGERDEADWRAWRAAGADRYLLRFETSNRTLYERIHPPVAGVRSDRIADLRTLQALGYEVGSGVMVGIPGQTYDDLADDIELFGESGLDMIGVGPFIAHPATPLGAGGQPSETDPEQVPNTELMTCKVMALARLNCPQSNIPSTTALATLNRALGRELGLQRGGNVVMPNLTPVQYRSSYEIYPAKACLQEEAADCHGCMKGRILAIGRAVGTGRGDSPHYQAKAAVDCGQARG